MNAFALFCDTRSQHILLPHLQTGHFLVAHPIVLLEQMHSALCSDTCPTSDNSLFYNFDSTAAVTFMRSGPLYCMQFLEQVHANWGCGGDVLANRR